VSAPTAVSAARGCRASTRHVERDVPARSAAASIPASRPGRRAAGLPRHPRGDESAPTWFARSAGHRRDSRATWRRLCGFSGRLGFLPEHLPDERGGFGGADGRVEIEVLERLALLGEVLRELFEVQVFDGRPGFVATDAATATPIAIIVDVLADRPVDERLTAPAPRTLRLEDIAAAASPHYCGWRPPAVAARWRTRRSAWWGPTSAILPDIGGPRRRERRPWVSKVDRSRTQTVQPRADESTDKRRQRRSKGE